MNYGRWNLVSYLISHFNLKGTPWAGVVIAGGFLLCMVIPYLLGSLNFGLIISNKQYHDDVRTHGSGNAGATNMLRTYGKKAALLTMLGDMLKATVAVALGYFVLNLDIVAVNEAGEVMAASTDPIGAAVAGLFVMLGHIFPCFFKFKGGKGVATAGMVILMINPWVFLICLAVFLIIVIGTKFVSLGSIMALIFYPIFLRAFMPNAAWTLMLAVFMALLVVWRHKDNIKRLLAHEESKISLGKKKTAQTAAEAQPATEAPTEPEKEYTFVTCVGCGRTIPQSRRVCAYCKTPNPHYIPDPDDPPARRRKGKK